MELRAWKRKHVQIASPHSACRSRLTSAHQAQRLQAIQLKDLTGAWLDYQTFVQLHLTVLSHCIDIKESCRCTQIGLVVQLHAKPLDMVLCDSPCRLMELTSLISDLCVAMTTADVRAEL